jgi:hypothetical protein
MIRKYSRSKHFIILEVTVSLCREKCKVFCSHQTNQTLFTIPSDSLKKKEVLVTDNQDMPKTREAITSSLRKIYSHFATECDIKQYYMKSYDDLSLQN